MALGHLTFEVSEGLLEVQDGGNSAAEALQKLACVPPPLHPAPPCPAAHTRAAFVSGAVPAALMKRLFVPCPWPESRGTALPPAPPAGLSPLSFASPGASTRILKRAQPGSEGLPQKARARALRLGRWGPGAARARKSWWAYPAAKPAQKPWGPGRTWPPNIPLPPPGGLSAHKSCERLEQPDLRLGSSPGGMSH